MASHSGKYSSKYDDKSSKSIKQPSKFLGETFRGIIVGTGEEGDPLLRPDAKATPKIFVKETGGKDAELYFGK
jgi:hypothetical protein